MSKPTTAYIGLGSNLGERRHFIESALEMLGENKQVEVVRTSQVSETTALAAPDQPKYLNAVAELRTTLSAEALHRTLSDVEAALGRQRNDKWAPRTVDLDLLLFGEEVINRPGLSVPHPQMHLRSFVLRGLCQLNCDLVHPVLKEPVQELAERLGGNDFAPDPGRAQLVSVAGVIGVGKTTLARKLAEAFNCKILLEPYDSNPFLPDVYAGKKALALDSQLYFLTCRARQLDGSTLDSGEIVVSDYIFDQDMIYAERLLSAEQLALYKRIHEALVGNVVSPVLVLYIQDSPERCMQRIRRRGRPYEQRIDTEFLRRLESDYEQLFAGWQRCPLIRIPAAKLNYTEGASVEHLMSQVRHYVAVEQAA